MPLLLPGDPCEMPPPRWLDEMPDLNMALLPLMVLENTYKVP